MDVSWGSIGDSRVSASGGARTAHADGQAGRHGHRGQSSGEAATTLALVDFRTVPGLRRGLDNALVSLGLGAGASGREGQIGGDRIFSDQALPELPIELWPRRELERAPDLVKHACTQAFVAEFSLEPWFLSQAEVWRIKESYDRHSDTPGFDPSPPDAAARSLDEDLSSEGGATPRPSSELFEDVKGTPKPRGGGRSPLAAEEPGSGEGGALKPDPTAPRKPHEHGSLATVLTTPRAPQASGPRVSAGSVAKSVVDAQAVANTQK